MLYYAVAINAIASFAAFCSTVDERVDEYYYTHTLFIAKTKYKQYNTEYNKDMAGCQRGRGPSMLATYGNKFK